MICSAIIIYNITMLYNNNHDIMCFIINLSFLYTTENLKELQRETKEEVTMKLQTSERIRGMMTLQIEQQQSDLRKQKGILK